MGKALRYVGLFFLGRMLLGKTASFLQSKLDWNFLGFKRGDFAIDVTSQPGNIIGKLKIRVEITNNNPVGVSIVAMHATLSQAGNKLGEIHSNDRINLAVGQPVVVAITTTITASDLAIRIANIIKKGGVLAPIDFNGQLYLSDNKAVPIQAKIQFLTFGG